MLQVLQFNLLIRLEACSRQFPLDQIASALIGFIPIVLDGHEVLKRHRIFEMVWKVTCERHSYRSFPALELAEQRPLHPSRKVVAIEHGSVEANEGFVDFALRRLLHKIARRQERLEPLCMPMKETGSR